MILYFKAVKMSDDNKDVKEMPARKVKEVINNKVDVKEVTAASVLDNKMPMFITVLKSEVARRKRLVARLEYHGLNKLTTFIDGVEAASDDVKDVIVDYQGCSKPEAGCMLSHIKSIATYLLKSKASHAIIGESDLVPHNDYAELLTKELASLQASNTCNVGLVMLSAYISGWAGISNSFGHFHTIGSQTYSALAYIISRQYAESIISKFTNGISLVGDQVVVKYKAFKDCKPEDCIKHDQTKPYSEANKRIVSEIITIGSGGYFINPPLMIDESIDTTIQSQASNQWHLNYYSNFGHKNFADADIACGHDDMLKLWKLL